MFRNRNNRSLSSGLSCFPSRKTNVWWTLAAEGPWGPPIENRALDLIRHTNFFAGAGRPIFVIRAMLLLCPQPPRQCESKLQNSFRIVGLTFPHRLRHPHVIAFPCLVLRVPLARPTGMRFVIASCFSARSTSRPEAVARDPIQPDQAKSCVLQVHAFLDHWQCGR